MSVTDDLAALQETLDKNAREVEPYIGSIREGLGKLEAALTAVAEAWSGSDLGYHARLYYHTLERPPLHRGFDVEWGGLHGLEGWVELGLDEVRTVVEEQAGITLDGLSQATDDVVASFKTTRDDVLVLMAPVAGASGFERETAMLSELEQLVWEPQQRVGTPGGYRVTRDSRAMAEGVKVAPHRSFGAQIANVEGKLNACERFSELALRAVRQSLQRLRSSEGEPQEREGGDDLALLLNLVRRFHLVALALRDRGRNRTALTMDDEYDVQYLFGGLLRLHFDDVRPEEWSPSYAGGAARLDFLLKRERMVVEVKRTRSGLSDRQIGEELTIDAARYSEHPDCDVLVCLVHDPDRRITNPRGLEDDLGRLARDGQLQIAVVIN